MRIYMYRFSECEWRMCKTARQIYSHVKVERKISTWERDGENEKKKMKGNNKLMEIESQST